MGGDGALLNDDVTRRSVSSGGLLREGTVRCVMVPPEIATLGPKFEPQLPKQWSWVKNDLIKTRFKCIFGRPVVTIHVIHKILSNSIGELFHIYFFPRLHYFPGSII